ncbi:uncharacterized protein KY384_005637 [Bacidia gigantensis]|uniref:uncharacterized protein n=1 Tax=Bacidia gigantensis TaxID=2732470 RepID=UPI001D0451D2|nr:uncharacterized protein KY384_005637 [Bacidia gigantensis]KAG8530154.1 hypothetical protein KY384_005637 [Bacidia gigantensis]
MGPFTEQELDMILFNEQELASLECLAGGDTDVYDDVVQYPTFFGHYVEFYPDKFAPSMIETAKHLWNSSSPALKYLVGKRKSSTLSISERRYLVANEYFLDSTVPSMWKELPLRYRILLAWMVEKAASEPGVDLSTWVLQMSGVIRAQQAQMIATWNCSKDFHTLSSVPHHKHLENQRTLRKQDRAGWYNMQLLSANQDRCAAQNAIEFEIQALRENDKFVQAMKDKEKLTQAMKAQLSSGHVFQPENGAQWVAPTLLPTLSSDSFQVSVESGSIGAERQLLGGDLLSAIDAAGKSSPHFPTGQQPSNTSAGRCIRSQALSGFKLDQSEEKKYMSNPVALLARKLGTSEKYLLSMKSYFERKRQAPTRA